MRLQSALLLAALAGPVAAQSDPSWYELFDGPPGDQNDSATLCGFDRFGNLYSIGFSLGFSGSLTTSDIVVLKYAPDGTLLWEHRWDGGAQDEPNAAIVTPDGEVYVAGYADKFTGFLDKDYVVLEIDASGQLVWEHLWDGDSSEDDEAWGLALDSSGNVYVTGSSVSGSYEMAATVKLDPLGQFLDVQYYIGPWLGDDIGTAVAVDSQDDVYVSATSTPQTGSVDYALLKYDSGGDLLWEQRYDGAGWWDTAYAVALDSQDRAYISGISYDPATGYDLATLAYAPDGTLLWERRFDGSQGGSEGFGRLVVDDLDRIWIAGCTAGGGFGDDALVVRYESDGTEAFALTWDGGADDALFDLAVDDASGRAVAAGWSANGRYDTLGMEIDAAGNLLWFDTWDSPNQDDDGAYGVATDGQGRIALVGDSYQVGSRYDLLTMVYDREEPGFGLDVLPLFPGSPSSITATDAPASSTVWFLYSLAGIGAGPCPNQLGGLCLDLLEPIEILGSAPSDANGTASLNFQVPPNAPPVDVFFQAVVSAGAASSKSVTVQTAVN